MTCFLRFLRNENIQECRSVGDGKRALRYLGLAPEAQLTELDFANAIQACAAAAGMNGGGKQQLVEEAVGAFRRLQGLKTARAGYVFRVHGAVWDAMGFMVC